MLDEEVEMMHGYRDLKIYDRSYKAALAIYRLTEAFPETEKYGLTNQIKRASVSIPLNVAEGHAKRESQAEFKRFLMMAIGSANEVSVLLDFAKDLKLITAEQHSKANAEYEEIGKMLNGLIKTVSQKSSI